jgi:hypothetical protein
MREGAGHMASKTIKFVPKPSKTAFFRPFPAKQFLLKAASGRAASLRCLPLCTKTLK